MYKIIREPKYDFVGQSYANAYPNLHKYPATMIPQLGIELFKDFDLKVNNLLDPYCGSGSSFIVGLERGIKELHGYDINPLATLICKAKFTKLDINKVKNAQAQLQKKVYASLKNNNYYQSLSIPEITNIDYWFSPFVLNKLALIKKCIDEIQDDKIKQLFLVPFSESVRECSYTRNNEFKLYRIKSEDIRYFNPDVFNIFFVKLIEVIHIYQQNYLPLIHDAKISIQNNAFVTEQEFYDVVLTSPPYGDSKTTVAYGQFSCFSNEWLGFNTARQIDKMLLGGKKSNTLYQTGIIAADIQNIYKIDQNRALEISAFYFDLEKSIKNVANSVKSKGIVIYIVGNRRVKDIQLLTDQFIAEQFEKSGFNHLITYERILSNKVMPSKNSPSNKSGITKATMTQEFIVVCEKK